MKYSILLIVLLTAALTAKAIDCEGYILNKKGDTVKGTIDAPKPKPCWIKKELILVPCGMK